MATPLRTCVGCRRVAEQSALVRVALVAGVPQWDPARRLPGRGAWLHADPECLAQAQRRGGFSRAFRASVDASGLTMAELPANSARPGQTGSPLSGDLQ